MAFQPFPAYFQGLLKEIKKQCIQRRVKGWGGKGKVRLGVHVMWRRSFLPYVEIQSTRECSGVEYQYSCYINKNNGGIMAIISFSTSRSDMAILHPLRFLKAYIRMETAGLKLYSRALQVFFFNITFYCLEFF